MAIANLTREISLALDSDFLGLPVQHHISNDGYWYTYHPSDFDSNNVLAGNSIIAYEWDSVLSVVSADRLSGGHSINQIETDGTFGFIDDSHGVPDVAGLIDYRYHGGSIVHIGPGVNDITGQTETDAFMMAHLGTFGDDNTSAFLPGGGSLEDDAFYWDRIYLASGASDWAFYQYHKHLPSNYLKFDDGRVVYEADGYINPSDKEYGYMISIQANSGGKAYAVPLARIHTPSVGGAHNSHNDVTLPNTAGINYVAGGILKGSSNRFHAFYLDSAAGNTWNVYSRTYTTSSGAFTPEVSYGAYDIANPNFDPYPTGDQDGEGTQSGVTLKASSGHVFGSKIYIPVTMKAIVRSYAMAVEAVNANRYQISGSDREGSQPLVQQPTMKIKVGDTLTIENPQYSAHPMYIRTSTSLSPSFSNHNVAGASGGGLGSSTLTFTPTSAGTVYYVCSLHSGMYGEIIVSEIEGKYDQQIWRMTDANTISPGTLERIDLPYKFHGTDVKSDVLITSVGSKMYVAAAGTYPYGDGGVVLYSTVNGDSTGSYTEEGHIVTNISPESKRNQLRLHGFKYNASNTKFYCLISGNTDSSLGGSTFTGKGLYSFDLAGGSYDGYEHLDWNTTSGHLQTRGVLTSGHLSYDHATSVISYVNSPEPEGIPNGTSILQWDVASPSFFNRKEINTNSEEYYFQGIYLSDGRKALVGRVEGHEDNTGGANTGDILLTIVDNQNNAVSYTFNATGDDFVTGIIEDVENDRLVLSGYAKGELVSKGQQWVHGWARNVHQSNDSAALRFTDIVRDSDGGYLVSAIDDLNKDPNIYKFDQNYSCIESKYFSIGAESSGFENITVLDDNSYIASGYTYNGTTEKHGYITRFDSSRTTIDWAKRFFSVGGNYHNIVDHTIVKNAGIEYIVGFATDLNADSDVYTKGILFTADINGNVLTAKTTSSISTTKDTFERTSSGFQLDQNDVYINKIIPGKPNSGEFLFAGTHGKSTAITPSKKQLFGFGRVQDADLVKMVMATSDDHIADWNTADSDQISWAEWKNLALLKYDSSAESVNGAYTYQVVLVGSTSNSTDDGRIPLVAKVKFKDSGGDFFAEVPWVNTISTTYGSTEYLSSVLVEDSDQRDWWWNETAFFHNGNKRIIIAGSGTDLDSDAIHPDYTNDILMRRDTFMVMLNDSDGTLEWRNSFGHMGQDDINKSMVWDAHDRNAVVVGSSTSHSVGQDGVLFRFWKDGWGQGVYHTAASTSNAYYYDSAHLQSITCPVAQDPFAGILDYTSANASHEVNLYQNGGTAARDGLTFAGGSFSSADIGTSIIDRTTVATDYNGSYGENGLFTAFLAIVDKAKLQEFKNTETFQNNIAAGKTIHSADDVFEIHQISTVGDATADDGNIFGYDVIKSADGEYYYIAGQTSGNLAKQNTGQSGVYDYTVFQWDIASKQFRIWQNGTAQDEEIYALTELLPPSYHVTSNEATDNGLSVGTVSWIPGSVQTAYYQCGQHAGMNGQITIDAASGGAQTFNIEISYANAPGAFRFIGNDRNGSINSATDNPTLTFRVGDTINFRVNSVNHPFHIQTQAGLSGVRNGHIAFTGRSTGSLGGHTNLGGYDIFLGILDPLNWNASYYQNGSGFNDKGMNLHDISAHKDDTLSIVYTTFGSVNGGNTFGSEDIGVINFHYNLDSWDVGQSTGSETSEEIEQNGKPSTLLQDGRIAVVCNTSGAFADNSNTFGLLDMGLGIFDLDSDGNGNYKGWKKYQVGSGSSDFSYSVDNNGSTLLLTGYSEATWDRAVHGVFVEFDPERNILAKRAG